MSEPTIAHQRGKCRICGCTVLNPCLDDNGIACAWMDREQTLCDNLECIGRVSIGELLEMQPPIIFEGVMLRLRQ